MSENDNPIGIGNFKPKQAVARQFSQAPRRLPSKKLIGRSMSARYVNFVIFLMFQLLINILDHVHDQNWTSTFHLLQR